MTSRNTRLLILFLLALALTNAFLAGTASAHPGHGGEASEAWSLEHYLSEPIHAVVWVGCLLLLFIAGGLILRMGGRRIDGAHREADTEHDRS